jgi:hypothetical protein
MVIMRGHAGNTRALSPSFLRCVRCRAKHTPVRPGPEPLIAPAFLLSVQCELRWIGRNPVLPFLLLSGLYFLTPKGVTEIPVLVAYGPNLSVIR